MPRKPTEPTYRVGVVKHKTFKSAAAAAADQSLVSGEEVAVEEVVGGETVGYITITAVASRD